MRRAGRALARGELRLSDYIRERRNTTADDRSGWGDLLSRLVYVAAPCPGPTVGFGGPGELNGNVPGLNPVIPTEATFNFHLFRSLILPTQTPNGIVQRGIGIYQGWVSIDTRFARQVFLIGGPGSIIANCKTGAFHGFGFSL
jgi:hypothetical protein